MRPHLSRLLAVVFVAAVGQAMAAEVGRVLLAAGDTVAVRDKQVIKLTFGSTVQERDVLRTGPASNLQVRFLDESVLSMRENSEIRIDEFRFTGKEDGTERAFFRLLKGGLRMITGIVGRTNHQNYRMSTVTATIGVRGTDYAATLCQQDCRNPDGSLAKDGLYGRVIGASFGTNRNVVTNETGEYLFGIGQNYHVPDAKTPPQLLLEPPAFVATRLEGQKQRGKPPAGTGSEQVAVGGAQQDPRGATSPPPPPELLQFVATESRGTGGNPVVVGSGAPTIAGVGALFDSLGFPGEPGDGGGFFAPSNVTLSGTGTSTVLLGFTLPVGFSAEPGGGNSAVIASSSGTIINETVPNSLNANWGRWTGGTLTDFDETPASISVSPTNQFHYLFGPLTPPEVVAAKTGSFPLSLVQGTTPTNNINETGSFFATGMNVNFMTRVVSASGFGFNFQTQFWSFSGISTPIQFATGKGAFINAVTTGFCSGSSCGGAANLGMTGIFMGPNGDHLGVGFNAVTTSGPPAHASTAKIFTCAPSC
ncbi:MAG TPA: FecR family protein [Burkholderiales bacterium]|nr:FecR family protein [Burkholderiales bacterium]